MFSRGDRATRSVTGPRAADNVKRPGVCLVRRFSNFDGGLPSRLRRAPHDESCPDRCYCPLKIILLQTEHADRLGELVTPVDLQMPLRLTRNPILKPR